MKLIKTALVIFSIFVLITACSKNNKMTLSEVEQKQLAEEKATAMEEPAKIPQTTEFDGTIALNESGLLLQTGAGKFIIEGQDLTDMVGKKVKIIGALVESERGKRIHISSVTPLE